MARNDTEGTPVECGNCSYEWTYTGSLQMASCPSCRRATPVETEARQ